jgi:hypothetical protein
MQRALALDNAPALRASLPLFLSVPVFASLAAAVLLAAGPDGLASRWSPAALAMTHVITLGVAGHAMAAGIIQILPVASGMRVPVPAITGAVVHTALSVGTLGLGWGFLTTTAWAITGGGVIAIIGWLVLVAAILCGMWRHRRHALPGAVEVRRGVPLAAFALVVTVALAAVLLGLRNGMISGVWIGGIDNYPAWTNLHAMWGVAGWIGLLLVTMAFQLIPVFQATDIYPALLTRRWAPGLFAMLCLATLWPAARTAALTAAAAAYGVFAAVSLQRLIQRKRPTAEPTTQFWVLSMLCLAGAVMVGAGYAITREHSLPVLAGTLLLAGVVWTAINGMLYTIVPFLLWFNLQRRLTPPQPHLPKIRQFISTDAQRRQFRVHAVAVVLLSAAAVWPVVFTYPAATLALGSSVWLGWNLGGAVLLYQKAQRRLHSHLTPDSSPAPEHSAG